MDHAGRPITDPNEAIDGLLLPIGGYKGFGLSLVFSLMGGALNGTRTGRDTVSIDDAATAGQHRPGHHGAQRREFRRCRGLQAPRRQGGARHPHFEADAGRRRGALSRPQRPPHRGERAPRPAYRSARRWRRASPSSPRPSASRRSCWETRDERGFQPQHPLPRALRPGRQARRRAVHAAIAAATAMSARPMPRASPSSICATPRSRASRASSPCRPTRARAISSFTTICCWSSTAPTRRNRWPRRIISRGPWPTRSAAT